MNIKDFLFEHYIYIIIIIVLIIITIVGFLADKKKNSDKKPKTMGGTMMGNQNVGPMNYQQPAVTNQPMNYQPMDNMQNNQNINYNQPQNINNQNNNMPNVQPMQDNFQMNMPNNQPMNFNQQINPVNDNQTINEVPNQPMMNNLSNQNIGMAMNTPQPVEPLNQDANVPAESMYQPLSEQKPTFSSSEPNINSLNMETQNAMPQPDFNNMINPTPQLNNQPIVEPMMTSQLNNQPVVEPIMTPQPEVMQPQPNFGAPNMVQNQIPQNQPVVTIPNQVGNTIPNPITPPQPVAPQQVNFVYGQGGQNQGNNN